MGDSKIYPESVSGERAGCCVEEDDDLISRRSKRDAAGGHGNPGEISMKQSTRGPATVFSSHAIIKLGRSRAAPTRVVKETTRGRQREQASSSKAAAAARVTPSLGAQRVVVFFFLGWRKLDTALLKVCNDDEMQTETTATGSQCEG